MLSDNIKTTETVSNFSQVKKDYKLYNDPSDKLFIIGITGTNGKTTTASLIYNIVSSYGIKCGLINNSYIKIDRKKYKSKLATLSEESIYYYLNKMINENVKIVVVEVYPHKLKFEKLCGIKFDIAIHTNIDVSQFNFYKTIDSYIKSKKKLFDNLHNRKLALINNDDKYALNMLKDNSNILLITYGLSSKSTVNASSINIDITTTFNYCLQRSITTLSNIKIEPFEYPITSNLLGRHNIYNALSVITTCLLLDIPIDYIALAIQNYKGVLRKMEIIYNKKYIVIDDFCCNPSSYEAVFNTVQNLQYNNLYIVNGIRDNKGKHINIENAKVLKQWCEILNVKKLIITNSLDYVENVNHEGLEGLNCYFETLKDSLLTFEYRAFLKDSIEEVLNQVELGDMVLLLGAQSMDEGRKIFFDLTVFH